MINLLRLSALLATVLAIVLYRVTQLSPISTIIIVIKLLCNNHVTKDDGNTKIMPPGWQFKEYHEDSHARKKLTTTALP